MKRLSLQLDDDELRILERAAQLHDQSIEEVIHAFIREAEFDDEDDEDEPDFFFVTEKGEVINDTVASNPGQISVQWTRFFRAFPRIPIGFGIVITALLYLLITRSLWWALPLVVVLVLLSLIVSRIKTQFRAGDTNPAVVVSQQPPLVAVLSDLTMGIGDFPIIKILRQPLRVCGLDAATPGTRLVTVALYNFPVNDAPHWSDFDPVIVQAATTNSEIHQERLASIDPEHWQQLEDALATLPARTPGVYPLGWQPQDGALPDAADNDSASKD